MPATLTSTVALVDTPPSEAVTVKAAVPAFFGFTVRDASVLLPVNSILSAALEPAVHVHGRQQSHVGEKQFEQVGAFVQH